MPFNFSSPEYLSHHRTRKNQVSPVNRASPAHMNSPLEQWKSSHVTEAHLIADIASLVQRKKLFANHQIG